VPSFLVQLVRSGPEWDPEKPMEEQTRWPEHAAYMDELVEQGLIVLGGPLADEHRVVHVAEAESAETLREAYARDPWADTHLRIDWIERWTIRLDARRS
jgi:uncharacterized protein YciI